MEVTPVAGTDTKPKRPGRATATDAIVILRALVAEAHVGPGRPDADWYRFAVSACRDLAAFVGLDAADLERRATAFNRPGR